MFDKFLELTGREKSSLATGAKLPASTVTQLYADENRIASGSTIASIVLAYDLEIVVQRRGATTLPGAARCDPDVMLAALRTLWLRHRRGALPEVAAARLLTQIYNWIVDQEERKDLRVRDPAAILDAIGPFADADQPTVHP
jgi:hypothetical protein